MRGVNRAILVGTLGKDPEVRYAGSGSAICGFSIATSESWKDKSTGERKQETEWHNIVVFGDLAKLCAEYLLKGSIVYVDGKIRTEEFTGKDGNKQRSTKIVADKVEFLSPKNQDSAPANGPSAKPAAKAPARQRPAAARDDFDDENLPF